MTIPTLQTGQSYCYDCEGREIPWPGSGQDGEFRSGLAWPEPRFVTHGQTVEDRLTGLVWSRNANPGGFPVTWNEALAGDAHHPGIPAGPGGQPAIGRLSRISPAHRGVSRLRVAPP